MSMTISYEYKDALYINLTNRCDCNCLFCVRRGDRLGSIYAHDLWLDREPTRQEALADLLHRDLPAYRELVFCGFGEPTFRMDDILWLCDRLHAACPNLPPLRLNTNGHANRICGRDVTPDLKGRIDILSISLNASSPAAYAAVTRPQAGEAAFFDMLDFAHKAMLYVPQVLFTVVDKDMTPGDIAACQALADAAGVQLRVRAYIPPR